MSVQAFRGATPYAAIKKEPPPKLIVDPPLPDLLDKGIAWILYRTENVCIVPVFGKEALDVPRGSSTYTSTSTTCPGCGRTRATSTPSTLP
ncbi:MAG: DUF6130 family protein [Nitrospirota bacterium]